MREAVTSGLDRVATLKPGAGFFDVIAGVSKPWDDELKAFVEADVGVKVARNVDLFGFAKADTRGASAGVGARGTF